MSDEPDVMFVDDLDRGWEWVDGEWRITNWNKVGEPCQCQ